MGSYKLWWYNVCGNYGAWHECIDPRTLEPIRTTKARTRHLKTWLKGYTTLRPGKAWQVSSGHLLLWTAVDPNDQPELAGSD